jgi:ceramide glucosyltransferase
VTFGSVLAILCGIAWLALTIVHAGTAILALRQPARRARRATASERPPISILIPVRRAEHAMEAALASAFAQRYPRFEILIAAAHADDPGLAVADRVRARHPGVPSRVVVSETPVSASPKINNLARPLAEAAHDHIFILDSNIRLAPDALDGFAAHFVAGTGMAVAVQIAVEPENFAAEMERAFINGYQGRLFLAASALDGGFGIGKAMLFRRSDFQRAGGIPAIAGSVLEDHAISKVLRRIGLRTVIVGTVVAQSIGARRWRDVWNRQFRWMVCRRREEPLAFALEPFIGGAIATCYGAASASLVGLPAWFGALGTIAIWLGVEAAFLANKGWGIRAVSSAAWVLRELTIPVMWLKALTTSTVQWGDLRLDVRRGQVAPLREATPESASAELVRPKSPL